MTSKGVLLELELLHSESIEVSDLGSREGPYIPYMYIRNLNGAYVFYYH